MTYRSHTLLLLKGPPFVCKYDYVITKLLSYIANKKGNLGAECEKLEGRKKNHHSVLCGFEFVIYLVLKLCLPYSFLSGLERFFFPYIQEILVIRKMQPCLPSFKAQFTASVPLTRIRDIAHRNDIPHDLKVVI